VETKISTRHGQVSDETRAKISAKVEKLTRFFERLTAIEVTVDLEHRETPKVTLRVAAEHKHDFTATSRADSLLGAVDDVVHKLEQQLRKYKERVQERHRNSGHRQQDESTVSTPESE